MTYILSLLGQGSAGGKESDSRDVFHLQGWCNGCGVGGSLSTVPECRFPLVRASD